MSNCNAVLHRKTKETDIALELNLTESKTVDINTPVPFLNHMLTAMAFHGGFALTVKASGDIDVDPHHIVEDIGLVLGDAFHQIATATGTVHRFGDAVIPMDDALSEVTIDICGRPYLVFNAKFPQLFSGNFDLSLLREFFIAFSNKAQIALHCNCHYGENSHHMAESLFKAFGKTLAIAYLPADDSRVLSTKGLI